MWCGYAYELNTRAEARCDIIVNALAYVNDDGKGLVWCGAVYGVDLVAYSWLLAGLYIGSWALMCVSYVGPKYHIICIFIYVFIAWLVIHGLGVYMMCKRRASGLGYFPSYTYVYAGMVYVSIHGMVCVMFWGGSVLNRFSLCLYACWVLWLTLTFHHSM